MSRSLSRRAVRTGVGATGVLTILAAGHPASAATAVTV
jgi:hypothetical protein